MATPITNTFTTPDAVGVRESLSDIIGKVDPVATPLYSNLEKTRAKSPLHEFQEWAIADTPPVTINYKLEGEEPDRNVATPTKLLNNPTSILSRDYVVSGTLASVDVAGRRNEMAWQKITRALELRAQVETALLANNVKVLTDTPRENAGLPTWAEGGDGTLANIVAPPSHDQAALEDAMQTLDVVGATGRVLLMLPVNKKAFSASVSTGTAKNIEAAITDRMPPSWSGAVSVYLSDLGAVQIVIDRYMDKNLNASFLFDDRHLRIAEVPGRVFADEALAASGDAEQRLIVWEGTLEVNSPSSVATLGFSP